jgi:8-oxo-dGTP pyrophosphatase MutT (NUDIX family)
MTSLEDARRRFAEHVPKLHSFDARIRASVAVVLCPENGDVRVLLIERAEAEGDRWSGHIAFPGGRVDPTDPSPRAAAERETLEETGVDLRRAEYLGRLDDLTGFVESILVSAFVYAVSDPGPFVPNAEVKEAFWMSLSDLCDPGRHVEHPFTYAGREIAAPAIRVLGREAPVLWGISYRFLELLLQVVGGHIPLMPWHSDL